MIDEKMGVHFPSTFIFGVSTSAYQIEGDNINNDWWRAEHEGRLPYKSGKACGFWTKYEEDVTIMKEIGIEAFRFSVEWSRVMPKPNSIDRGALSVYSRIVDMLLDNRIKPLVTLLHFTLPAWFADLGGFEKRDNLKYWREYVKVVANEIGDRVSMWGPINEIQGYAANSYLLGYTPPFKRDVDSYRAVVANSLLAHSEAYDIIKDVNRLALVGPVLDTPLIEPVPQATGDDKRAAELADRFANGIYIDAFRDRRLPPELGEEELGDCSDFIGINYYTRFRIKHDPANFGIGIASPPAGSETSEMGWEVYPRGFYYTVKRYYREVGKPIIVTENGISTYDDRQRVRFILRHLLELKKATDEGCEVRGYFYWSLMDNYEWREGFRQRFGLVEIDYRTLERRLRDSARIYGSIARSKSVSDDMLKEYGLTSNAC